MRTRKIATLAATGTIVLTGAMAGLSTAAEAAVPARNYDTPAKVSAWYKNEYLPAMRTRVDWSGSISGCRTGSFSTAALTNMNRQLNAIRDISGLDRVTLRRGAGPQQAALMMEAANTIDHYPGRNWRCYTKAGAAAAKTSNLALNTDTTAGTPIDQYMEDAGPYNTAVGHRRWLLNPKAKSFLVGQTKTINVLQVIGTPTNPKATTPRWVTWPRMGWSPTQLDPSGRWSISSNIPNTTWKNPRVTVTKNGKPLGNAKVHPVEHGYGPATLVWEMPPEKQRVGTYTIRITGTHINGKATPVAYTSRLFVAK